MLKLHHLLARKRVDAPGPASEVAAAVAVASSHTLVPAQWPAQNGRQGVPVAQDARNTLGLVA